MPNAQCSNVLCLKSSKTTSIFLIRWTTFIGHNVSDLPLTSEYYIGTDEQRWKLLVFCVEFCKFRNLREEGSQPTQPKVLDI